MTDHKPVLAVTVGDPAGIGKASAVSLVEALRVGAQYAGRGVRPDAHAASTLATAA